MSAAADLSKALESVHISSSTSEPVVSNGLGRVDGADRLTEIRESIKSLSRTLSRLLDHIYEIQEIRHTPAAQSPRLAVLVSELDKGVEEVTPRLTAVQSDVDSASSSLDSVAQDELKNGLQSVQEELDELSRQHLALKEEMKEQGWLGRFRATADQAETMMAPLQKSLDDCMKYVERITTSATPVRFDSELDEVPSISGLQSLMGRHEAIKGTYVSSAGKILRLMDKSISERPSKNGEALRRYGELSQRWAELQKRLQQLDTRVRLVLEVHGAEDEQVEVLNSPERTPGEYFDQTPVRQGMSRPFFSPGRSPLESAGVSTGSNTAMSSIPSRPPSRSRLSSVSSVASSSFKVPPVPPVPGATSPVRPPVIKRRKSSFLNQTSSSAAKVVGKEKERPPPLPVTPGRRVASYTRTPVSPTASVGSSSGSKIPVIKTPPAREAPTPTNRRQSTYTPGRPSLAPRPSTLPRPPRPPPPPSSFRSFTPTNVGRPSSRLSMGSRAASAISPAVLTPFIPSKYDLLDTTVQSIIDEVGFTLLVSRLDEPLKRGQRRRDDEEWKGEYVFGAGQRSSSVKLLKLAGRSGTTEAPRVKCLVRVGGAWLDLASVLKKRKQEADVEELEVF